jgi:uncharacterized protein (TIGR02001 family)
MRTSFGPLLGLALMLASTPAFAQDEEAKTFTVTGGATLVSDYRFRGISQTDKEFAVQGTFSVTHESGIYATVWGSSVDEYVAAGSDQEIDLSVGFKKTFGSTTVDVGGLYYYYPGAEKFIPGYNSDFLELYGSIAQGFGPVTGKLLVAYAPKSSALDFGFGKEDNFYANASLSGGIPDTGISLTAGVGRTFTRSFLSGGSRYTDWNVGISYTTGPLTLGVSYVDTSYNKNVLVGLTGKDIAKAGVVGSIGVAF